MTSLPLREFHSALNATFIDRNGFEAVQDFGDPALEHRALTESCAFLDLSYRSRLVLLGADRQKLLNGQVTNNIKDLKPGTGCYAAMVNAKARMVADLHVYALPDELVLDLEPGMGGPVAERLEKFIVADDVQVVDAAPHYGLLSVQGPRAARVVEALGMFPSVPNDEHDVVTVSDPTLGALYLMNRPRTGSKGFDLYAPTASLGAVADKGVAATREVGGRAAGWSALELARIEAGIPRFGIDMDDTILPPEAGIADRAVSYTKGCYSGQEVIARIRTYGQVSKALRGMVLSGPLPDLPLPRTKLYLGGKEVGFLTSTARSPRRGEPVALGYVRRECNGPGVKLAVGRTDSEVAGVIVPLPFVGPMLAGA